MERDRKATEQRLIDTVGEMIEEEGFEKLGVNAIANRAGVSKILIYRYFNSVNGLVSAYIQQNDFWINFPQKLPAKEEMRSFLKKMFYEFINKLKSSPARKRLYRWELSASNPMIDNLKAQRETNGLNLIKEISHIMGYPFKEVAAIASIITSSITYFVMLEEFCPVYNGIELNSPSGWEQIYTGIEEIIDHAFLN